MNLLLSLALLLGFLSGVFATLLLDVGIGCSLKFLVEKLDVCC